MIVNGIVKDASTGETLPSATIYKVSNLDTSPITSTDLDGNFSAVISPNEKIKVSYVGYLDTIVNPKPNLTIVMLEASQSVGAVTVTGQKTPKKNIQKDMFLLNIMAVGLVLVAALVAYFYFKK